MRLGKRIAIEAVLMLIVPIVIGQWMSKAETDDSSTTTTTTVAPTTTTTAPTTTTTAATTTTTMATTTTTTTTKPNETTTATPYGTGTNETANNGSNGTELILVKVYVNGVLQRKYYENVSDNDMTVVIDTGSQKKKALPISVNDVPYANLLDNNVAGYLSRSGEYKFVTIVQGSNDAKNRENFCLGALVSPNVVVTLATCLYSDANHTNMYRTAYVGNAAYDRQFASYGYWVDLATNGTNKNVYVHRDFQSFMDNNLALIVLPTNVDSFTYVRPVSIEDEYSAVRTKGMRVIGYGRSKTMENRHSYQRWIEMIRADPSVCSANFNDAVCNSDTLLITTGQNSLRESLCQLEDGAPLVTRSFGVNKLVGLGAFVYGGANDANEPECNDSVNLNGFVYLTSYIDWINSVTNRKIVNRNLYESLFD